MMTTFRNLVKTIKYEKMSFFVKEQTGAFRPELTRLIDFIRSPKLAKLQQLSRLWIVLLLLLLTGLTLFFSYERSASLIPGRLVFGFEGVVTKGDIKKTVIVDGTLFAPNSQQIIVPKARDYWEFNILWTADEGTIVQESDEVIRLDATAIEKDLKRLQLERDNSELVYEEEKIRSADAIAEAKAMVMYKEFDLKRKELQITDSDSISANEKNKRRLEVAEAQAVLRQARERVILITQAENAKLEYKEMDIKRASDELAYIEQALESTIIRAPQTGMLLFPSFRNRTGLVKAAQGVTVQVSTVVAEITGNGGLEAKIFIPEVDIQGMAIGTEGELVVDIDPAKRYQGSIKTLANIVSTPGERRDAQSDNPSLNITQYEAVFAIENPPEEVVSGMSVRVELAAIKKPDAVLVPIEAVTMVIPKEHEKENAPTAYNGTSSGFVYCQKSGSLKWRWCEVALGIHSNSFVEVLSGLAVGDRYKEILW